MNGLMIVGLAIVVFAAAYLGYGRWLVRTWGIDTRAKTPAVRLEDGQDYVPASRFTVFAHQFSSITGAGPVTGPIIAAMFGWLPALLWLLVGGIFFGAVQDFTALYASVKNDAIKCGWSRRASARSMSSRMERTLLASIVSAVSARSSINFCRRSRSRDFSTTWYRRALTSGRSP